MNNIRMKRSKTEKRESPQNILPILRPSKRLLTLDLNGHCSAKKRLSEKIPRNNLTRKDLSELKKIEAQNIMIGSSVKNQYKYNRKKQQTSFLMVNPLKSQILKQNRSKNIVMAVSDQHKGTRQYNQDRVCCITQFQVKSKSYSFFAVFDGHGGSAVAQYLKNNLFNQFCALLKAYEQKNITQILKLAIYQMQEEIVNKKLSGGSCASILVIHRNKYYIAHVGDSRILKISFTQKKQKDRNIFVQLTNDHKPNDEKQKKRIEGFGGKIYRSKVSNFQEELYGPYRLLPGRLSVSRSLGDIQIKKQGKGRILICQPQLVQGTLCEQQLFILMSDGAYERFSSQEIVDHFRKIKDESKPYVLKKSLQTFFINSILRESPDNVSMVCIKTKYVQDL